MRLALLLQHAVNLGGRNRRSSRAPEPMISGLVALTTNSRSALRDGPGPPVCPDCSGKLKHGLAIARFLRKL